MHTAASHDISDTLSCNNVWHYNTDRYVNLVPRVDLVLTFRSWWGKGFPQRREWLLQNNKQIQFILCFKETKSFNLF